MYWYREEKGIQLTGIRGGKCQALAEKWDFNQN